MHIYIYIYTHTYCSVCHVWHDIRNIDVEYGTLMLNTEHRKMTYGTTSYKYEHVPYPT